MFGKNFVVQKLKQLIHLYIYKNKLIFLSFLIFCKKIFASLMVNVYDVLSQIFGWTYPHFY